MGLSLCLDIPSLEEDREFKETVASYPVLTNADGSHIYTTVLTFYEVYEMKDFEAKFKVNFRLKEPKQSDLEETKMVCGPVNIESAEIDLSSIMATKTRKHIKKKDINVRVAKSLCLISKHQCFTQMKQILKNLYKQAIGTNSDVLETLVPFLISDVPKPLTNTIVTFRVNDKKWVAVAGIME